MEEKELPSGSLRPDQPIRNSWKLPSSAAFSEVANSVTRIFRSKPVSATIDWRTSATCRVSGLLGTIKSSAILPVTPASLSSALALATSRLGTGSDCW